MFRHITVGISVVFFGVICLFFTFCNKKPQQQAAQPNNTFVFAGHNPATKYTGSQSCLPCHQSIYSTYVHTGKGRAFYEPNRRNSPENFENALVYDAPSNFYYRPFWKDSNFYIAEFRLSGTDTTHYREEKVAFVIGSGNQARTYILEKNGYFFEMPITWYSHKKIWAMSPGYDEGKNTRFDRPIGDMCMNCHNSEQVFSPFSINKFTQVGRGMSCEKCHGPGEAHVTAMQRGDSINTKIKTDFTIVNPARLSIQLQFDVCRQCHLEGITVPKEGKKIVDFKPGMRLTSYYDVFLPVAHNSDQFGFASHAERLQMSKCFIVSDGKLNCTTCHDPHKPLPENTALFYSQKCQSCHKPSDCGEDHFKMAKADNNCAGCHMPKGGTTDIPHVSSTDHFIRKKPNKNKTPDAPPKGTVVDFKSFTTKHVSQTERSYLLANLIYFEQQDHNPEYLKRVINYVSQLGIDAQVKYAYLSGEQLPDAVKQLQPSQVTDPYTASYIADRYQKLKLPALAWNQRALELASDNVEFKMQQTQIYTALGDLQKAKNGLEWVVKQQPMHKKALANLGFLYLQEQNFILAKQYTERAITADPDYTLPQENLVSVYLQQGNLAKGLELLDKLIKKHPDNQNYKALRAQIVQAKG